MNTRSKSNGQSQGDITPTTIINDNTLTSVLPSLAPRWKNLVTRLIMGSFMIGVLSLLVYLGAFALIIFLLCIQLSGFYEITNIGYTVSRSQNVPLFRTLSWFFLFTTNYFLFGEGLVDEFRPMLKNFTLLNIVINYHYLISFSMCTCGLIAFVMSLSRKYYFRQFTMLGWTLVAILVMVFSTHLAMRNVFYGVIWFILPCAMTTCNDIMAYFFGFFFGKTPLIQLSPKKTWEGFIGGGISTIIISMIMGHILIQFDSLVCPARSLENCDKHPVFHPTSLNLTFNLISDQLQITLPWYRFHWHSALMALFSSLVGPFGGFFASGFKRAFKIKDFSDLIPGHGGIMDRIDCQIIMMVFVYAYYQTFIHLTTPRETLQKVQRLADADQLWFHDNLAKSLQRRGMILQ